VPTNLPYVVVILGKDRRATGSWASSGSNLSLVASWARASSARTGVRFGLVNWPPRGGIRRPRGRRVLRLEVLDVGVGGRMALDCSSGKGWAQAERSRTPVFMRQSCRPVDSQSTALG